MTSMRSALLVTVAVVLAACGGSSLDRRYLDTALDEPLELPPDLSKSDARSVFDLPQAFAGDDPAKRDEVPVLARVESVRLQGSPGVYWLEVDSRADNLYQHVKNFWAAEGYRLVVDEPIIGVLQTEWIYKEIGREKPSDSWWAWLFATNDLSAIQDQFRTRIERDPSGQGSRVYLVHRGTEYVDEIQAGNRDSEDEANNEWQLRRTDPELEIEMLSRLMIYLGLQQTDVENQIAQVRLFTPRARLELDVDEQSPFLILFDAYQIAWNRVYNLLERMNYQIETAEFQSGLSGEGVFIVKVDVVTNVDRGFFSFEPDEEREAREFTLVLSEESHLQTQLVLEDEGGNFDTSPEGGEFAKLLYEQLR